ncbi:homeobox protein H2.0 [Drosophila tropicalis]|uniref:homeobox protein H2.0 n=1 Tax=Drosophila tropicalis TaxID=46794 RepID=UPI0035AB87C1
MLLHESSASMEQSVPENLSTHVFSECEVKLKHDPVVFSDNASKHHSDVPSAKESNIHPPTTSANTTTSNNNSSATKVKLSFSVDRLLGSEPSSESLTNFNRHCCDGNLYACCTYPNCYGQTSSDNAKHFTNPAPAPAPVAMPSSIPYGNYAGLDKFYPAFYMDYKSILRPTPIRPEHATTLATNALLRFHQQHHQQQQQQQQHQQQQHLHPQQHKSPTGTSATAAAAAAAALLAPLHSLKTLQLTQQQRFLSKPPHQLLDIPPTTTATATTMSGGHHNSISNSHNGNSSSSNSNNNNSNGKRKRSWSRAVFTNLQRKGLEIQFQQQKYITKPDRRKLAARLNLTDAQVKVWFQNRRMKWRHTRENLKSGQEKQPTQQQQQQQQQQQSISMAKPTTTTTTTTTLSGLSGSTPQENLDYSSDSCSSADLSDQADDDDDNIEIDVVE